MSDWEVVAKKSKNKIVNGHTNLNDISKRNAFDQLNSQKEEKIRKDKEPLIKPKVKKVEPHNFHPKTLIEALNKVDGNELLNMFENVRDMFPNNPIIWLKDIAVFLTLKLEVPQKTSSIYEEFDRGFPLVNFGHSDILKGIVKSTPLQDLDLFFIDFINLITKQTKETHGNKLLIQAILSNHPKIVLNNKLKIINVLKVCKNKETCLSLFWTITQVSSKSPEAFQIWSEILLPVIHNDILTKYIVEFCEKIVRANGNKQNSFRGIFNPNDFMVLYNILFSPHPIIREDYRFRLFKLYPTLKEFAFNDCNSKNIKFFFPLLLSQLTESNLMNNNNLLKTEKNEKMNQYDETCEMLVRCISIDENCCDLWKKILPKYYVNSVYLEQYMKKHWQSIKYIKGINSKNLSATNLYISKNIPQDVYTSARSELSNIIANCGNSSTTRARQSASTTSYRHNSTGFCKMFILNSLLFGFVAFSLLYYDTNRPDPENSIVLKINQKIDEYGYKPYADEIERYVKIGIFEGKKNFDRVKNYYFFHWDPKVRKWTKQAYKTGRKYYKTYRRESLPYIKKAKAVSYEYYVSAQPYIASTKDMAHNYLLQLQKLATHSYHQLEIYVAKNDSTSFKVVEHFFIDGYQRLKKYMDLFKESVAKYLVH